MSDILSQTEIDALLKDLSSGEIVPEQIINEKKRINKYDFSRPNIFAKDHIRTLNMIHDNYGKIISEVLTRYLRSQFQADLISLEVLTYKDFSNSIPTPSILSIIGLKPLIGSIILAIPPTIAYVIIDRVMGGFCDPLEKIKAFTDIEISILRGILEQLTEAMREPWVNVADINPVLEGIETNPQIAQITSQTEMIILATYKATIDNVEDLINICIPHVVIDPIMPNLSTKLWFDQSKENRIKDDDVKAVKEKILNAKLELTAELGRSTITLGDITNLQAGDVIPLGQNINTCLELYLGDILKFKGKPGIRNSKYSIEVLEIIKEGRQV